MKSLSRVLFFTLLVLISSQTFAQRFGIQAGVNMSNMTIKYGDEDLSDDLESLLGFNAGINFEVGFGDLISLEAAVIANTKGTKMSEGDDFLKYNLLFVDVPLMIKVGPSFGPAKVFAAAGPYVGFGLTGKYIAEFDGEKETEDIVWGSDEEADSKRLDYGAKFGVGGEISGITLGVYYHLGLANLGTGDDSDYKEHHKFFSVSVGYKFGK